MSIKWSLPSGLTTKILYSLFLSPVRATYTAHLFVLNFPHIIVEHNVARHINILTNNFLVTKSQKCNQMLCRKRKITTSCKLCYINSSVDVSLTVYLSITLVNDQLDAQMLIYLLQSCTCTCFEQYLAHPQEVKLY
jgi:phosphate/sulfate permease